MNEENTEEHKQEIREEIRKCHYCGAVVEDFLAEKEKKGGDENVFV